MATPTKAADDAESPTSAGLTSKVGGLDLDNDTVMGEREEAGEAPKEDTESKATPSLLTQQLNQTSEDPEPLSPHADDKPAPLFAGKNREGNTEAAKIDTSRFTTAAPEADAAEATPIDEASSAHSVVFGNAENPANQQFEVDIDGTPVVGDLLKITFVENKVVPTILVGAFLPSVMKMLTHAGFLLPVPLEQLPSQCCV